MSRNRASWQGAWAWTKMPVIAPERGINLDSPEYCQ